MPPTAASQAFQPTSANEGPGGGKGPPSNRKVKSFSPGIVSRNTELILIIS